MWLVFYLFIKSSIVHPKAFDNLYTVSACALFIFFPPCSYFCIILTDTVDFFANSL